MPMETTMDVLLFPLSTPIKISSSCHPIPNIPVQIQPACVPNGISSDEPSLSRVVVAVGKEKKTGLVVRVIPPLRLVSEGIVRIGDQRIPPGVVGGGGKDILVRVQPLNHAPLRVEGVIDARYPSSSGEQTVRPHAVIT